MEILQNISNFIQNHLKLIFILVEIIIIVFKCLGAFSMIRMGIGGYPPTRRFNLANICITYSKVVFFMIIQLYLIFLIFAKLTIIKKILLIILVIFNFYPDVPGFIFLLVQDPRFILWFYFIGRWNKNAKWG